MPRYRVISRSPFLRSTVSLRSLRAQARDARERAGGHLRAGRMQAHVSTPSEP